MIKARKYSAKVALHIDHVGERPKIAILKERFSGSDTWASPEYRKSPHEIDKEVRNKTIHDLVQIVKFGTDIFHTPGREDFGREIVPRDFSGLVICDLENESNNVNGVVRARINQVQKFSYVDIGASQRELAEAYSR